MLAEEYLKVMENKDYEGLAALFDTNGSINDYCPNGKGEAAYHVYGKEAIDMFFRNRFTFGHFSISKAVCLDDVNAEFVASYDGYLVFAKATIEKSPTGEKIRRVQIRPR